MKTRFERLVSRLSSPAAWLARRVRPANNRAAHTGSAPSRRTRLWGIAVTLTGVVAAACFVALAGRRTKPALVPIRLTVEQTGETEIDPSVDEVSQLLTSLGFTVLDANVTAYQVELKIVVYAESIKKPYGPWNLMHDAGLSDEYYYTYDGKSVDGDVQCYSNRHLLSHKVFSAHVDQGSTYFGGPRIYKAVAGTVLEAFGPERLIAALTSRKEQSLWVAEAVASALAESKDSRVVPLLAEAVEHALPDARREVLIALAKMGSAGVPSLIGCLGSGDLEVREQARDALSRMSGDVVKPLSDALHSANSRVRAGAAEALGGLCDYDAREKEREEGRAIAPAVRGDEIAPAYGGLVDLLTDRDARCRESAAAALRGMFRVNYNRPPGVPIDVRRSFRPLLGRVGDRDEGVRKAAIAALWYIRPDLSAEETRAAFEAVLAHTRDRNAEVRQAAIEGLDWWAISTDDKTRASEAATAALRDSSGDVRQAAAREARLLVPERR